MNVKVRGIYSTALVKLFLDLGYEISRPSEKQMKRFNISFKGVPDVFVRDTPDREGIIIYGDKRDVLKIVEDLKNILIDSLFIETNLGKILKGKKIREEDYFVYQTEIGEVYVRKEENPREEEDLQVKKENGKIFCSKYIKIFGEFLDIIKFGKDIIDFRIKEDVKNNLLSLLKLVKRENWGIKFKKSCESASIEDILDEIEKLYSRSPLYFKILFGLKSKILLDEIRSKVCNTVIYHHILRKEFSDLLDFLEINEIKISEKNIFYFFKNKIEESGYIERYHRKVFDKGFFRTEVPIEIKVNDKFEVITRRIIKGSGKYDGLEIEKEEGDYSIIKYSFGSDIIETVYYNKEGKEKGRYININTPLEIVGNKIKYYDLEVDIVLLDGEKKIIDKDKFEILKEKGIITKKYYDVLKEKIESI